MTSEEKFDALKANLFLREGNHFGVILKMNFFPSEYLKSIKFFCFNCGTISTLSFTRHNESDLRNWEIIFK